MHSPGEQYVHTTQPGSSQDSPVEEAVNAEKVPLIEKSPKPRTEQKEPLIPSAPPIDEMEKIQGYNDILPHDVTFVPPPPSYQEATCGKSVDDVASRAKLTETEARAGLMALVKANCCWGKWAAEGMKLRSLEQTTAVHYKLRTFLETRRTDWASVPFKGQVIDGPQNGTPPAPWDIQVKTPDMFNDKVIKSEVSHTASVRVCHRCKGTTKVTCPRCDGSRYTSCSGCGGSGNTGSGEDLERCSSCCGTGTETCGTCDGHGHVPCNTCDATGKVKCFVQLTVTFKTVDKDFILERTPLPDHLIRKVSGMVLYEDTQPLLNPIQSFPEQVVNENSAKIVNEHRGLMKTGRIWMQNHVIRGVPVFQCDCSYKDKEFQFFVYGDDKKVFSANYPQTCCCCRSKCNCQIL